MSAANLSFPMLSLTRLKLAFQQVVVEIEWPPFAVQVGLEIVMSNSDKQKIGSDIR
jgi:hypothetical protein